jgi:hypothetical protein
MSSTCWSWLVVNNARYNAQCLGPRTSRRVKLNETNSLFVSVESKNNKQSDLSHSSMFDIV